MRDGDHGKAGGTLALLWAARPLRLLLVGIVLFPAALALSWLTHRPSELWLGPPSVVFVAGLLRLFSSA